MKGASNAQLIWNLNELLLEFMDAGLNELVEKLFNAYYQFLARTTNTSLPHYQSTFFQQAQMGCALI